MKKKILAVALAVAMLAIVGYNTIAYFTSTDDAVNTITAGKLEIAVNEYKDGVKTAAGEDGVTLKFTDVKPGDICPKVAKVESLTGSIDAWIRVKVTMAWDKADLLTDNTVVTLTTADGWTLNTDGYYYYSTKVSTASETEFLKEVKFNAETMGNAYQGAVLTVTVKAEAVQFANNGATVDAAKGWPNA